MASEIKVYTDGGSRGNPGKSAGGFVVLKDDKLIASGSYYFGIATNNQAEYKALIYAFDWLLANKEKIASKLNIYMDSELVVKQLKGEYKIKEKTLQLLSAKVLQSQSKLGVSVNYNAVAREKNKLADRLVNEELDKH